ncbi:MAG: ribosome silencing factor [Cytophagaceae bacterium]
MKERISKKKESTISANKSEKLREKAETEVKQTLSRLKGKNKKENSSDQDTEKLKEVIVAGMQEKKASHITIIDLKGIKNAVADYFILCTGNSNTQIDAISDSVEEEVIKSLSLNPWRKEGKENKEWVLLDYVDVVAHVFKEDKRKFYALEELWGDAKIINIEG